VGRAIAIVAVLPVMHLTLLILVTSPLAGHVVPVIRWMVPAPSSVAAVELLFVALRGDYRVRYITVAEVRFLVALPG
jgi:hypothetical protein